MYFLIILWHFMRFFLSAIAVNTSNIAHTIAYAVNKRWRYPRLAGSSLWQSTMWWGLQWAFKTAKRA